MKQKQALLGLGLVLYLTTGFIVATTAQKTTVTKVEELAFTFLGNQNDASGDTTTAATTTEATTTTMQTTTPTDFCQSDPCHPKATCTSTANGFTCQCNSPLVGDGFRCAVRFFFIIEVNVVFNFASRRFSLNIPIKFGNQFFEFLVITQNGVVYFSNDVNEDLIFNNPLNQALANRILAPFWFFCPDCILSTQIFSSATDISSKLSPIVTLPVLQNPSSSLYLPNPLIALVFEWRSSARRFQCIVLSTYVKTVAFYVYDISTFQVSDIILQQSFLGFINSNGITTQTVNSLVFPFSSNIGTIGVYAYVISSPEGSATSRCISWYNQQPELNLFFDRLCPSTLRRNFLFRPVPRVYSVPGSSFPPIVFPGDVCYQRRRRSQGPLCCYRHIFVRRFRFGFFRVFVLFSRLLFVSHFQATQITSFSRFFPNRLSEFEAYHKNEYGPFLDCGEAGLLELFYRRRPRVRLFGRSRIAISIFFGDPHIDTFSGAQYTFNGLGEYYIIYVPGQLIAQARFTRAIRADGNTTDATITSALVVCDDNTKEKAQFVVSGQNDTIVYINSTQVQFPDTTGVEFSVGNISYSLTDDGEFEVAFGTNYTVTVSTAFGVLKYSFGLDTDFQSRVRGLMGPSFILRNGTELSNSDLLNTDRSDVLNNTFNQERMFAYGQSWAVPESESKFDYPNGTTWSTFNPSNFTPAFLENLFDSQTPERISTLLAQCNNRLPCVYDLLQTNNMAFAQETGIEAEDFAAEQTALNNSIPEINFTTPYPNNVLRLMVGNVTTQLFTATDADNNTLLFSVSNLAGISISATSGLLTANISRSLLDLVRNSNASTTPELVVSVNDSITENSVTVVTRLCDCSGRGECAWNLPNSFGTPQFGIVPCTCSLGFEGPFCDQMVDFCAGSPCFTTCTSNSTGFTCGPCPDGTTGNGTSCMDIDECATDTDTCDNTTTQCMNINRNFSCQCLSGFMKPAGAGPKDACVDIDECTNPTPPCPSGQLCNNTFGSFECSCPFNLTAGQSCNSFLFMTVVSRSGSVNSTLLMQFFQSILQRYFPSSTAIVSIISMTNATSNSVRFQFAVDISQPFLDVFAALRDGSVLDSSAFSFDEAPRPIHQDINRVCTGTVLQPFNVPTSVNPSEFQAETVCGRNALYFRLNACNVTRFGINPLRLVLGPVNSGGNSQACTSVLMNGENGTLNVILLYGFRESCGITLQTNNDTIFYNFTVTSNDIDSSSVIQRNPILNFVGSCAYSRVTDLLSPAIIPALNTVTLPEVVQPGSVSFTVSACTDATCKTPLTTVQLPNPIFYSITLPSRFGSTTILKAESCWATTTTDPNSSPRYDLITNECPNATNVEILINNQNQTVLFRVTSFVWTANSSFDIYVHCMVSLCVGTSGSCTGQTCSRKRRSAPMIKKQLHLISLPPVEVASTCDEPNACEHSCKLISDTPTCFCRPGYDLAYDQTSCLIKSEPVQHEYKNMAQETWSYSTTSVLSILTTALAFLLAIIMIIKMIRSKK